MLPKSYPQHLRCYALSGRARAQAKRLELPAVFVFQGRWLVSRPEGRSEEDPKQEYTAEFKEQAVKHPQAVGIVRGVQGTGSGRADAAQLGEGGRCWQPARRGWRQAGDAEQMELSRLRAENARLKITSKY